MADKTVYISDGAGGVIGETFHENANGTYQRTLRDGGPGWATVFGVSSAAVVSADLTTRTAVTAAPTTGQKLIITDIIVSVDTAMSVLFETETTNVDIVKVFLPANGTVQITPRGELKLATADKKLMATASVAGNLSITVLYYSEL